MSARFVNMFTHLASLLLFISAASPQQPSVVLVVDWNGSGDHTTITDALADPRIAAGARIEVKGLVDSSGLPVAYSEKGPSGGSLIAMETFPLIVPEGVEIRQAPNSPPVYIWSDGTPPQSTDALVYLLDDNLPNSAPRTTLRNLTLIGTKHGVLLSHKATVSAANRRYDLLLKNVTFAGSSFGLLVDVGNACIAEVSASSCKLRHFDIDPNLLTNPPATQLPQVGLSFSAFSNFSNNGYGGGTIDAIVTGLTTVGTQFPTTTRSFNGQTDFQHFGVLGASRAVEFVASGDIGLNQHTQNHIIPTVTGTVSSSTLDGKRLEGPGLGWDIGVYAASRPIGFSTSGDYHSAVDVAIGGGSISSFALDGVYASAETSSRTSIRTENTSISSNGELGRCTPVGGNGVHTYSYEGYVALFDDASRYSGNSRNGVLAHTYGSRLSDPEFPVGNLVRLDYTQIDSNLEDGIQLAGPKTYLTPNQAGVVGGTWEDNLGLGNESLIEWSQKTLSMEYGIGRVHKALIHDNGSDGIEVWINHADGNEHTVASCLFANCFVWDNAQIGFHIRSNTQISQKPKVVTPITHCTFARNGQGSFKVQGIDLTNTSSFLYFDPATSNAYFWPKMRIHNSIFEMSSTSASDIDSVTESLLESIGAAVPANRIGIGGCRIVGQTGLVIGPNMTTATTPFAGSTSPSLSYPEWLFLDVSTPANGDFRDSTPLSGYDLNETLSFSDYAGGLRPLPSTGDRDKGAHEIQ